IPYIHLRTVLDGVAYVQQSEHLSWFGASNNFTYIARFGISKAQANTKWFVGLRFVSTNLPTSSWDVNSSSNGNCLGIGRDPIDGDTINFYSRNGSGDVTITPVEGGGWSGIIPGSVY